MNGNGIRDPGDSPLPGVIFHVNDIPNRRTDVGGSYPTNSKGEAHLSLLPPGCPQANFEIYPDVPPGFRALSNVRPTAGADSSEQVFEFGFSQLPGLATLTPHAPAPKCVSYHLGLANHDDITEIAVAADGSVWVSTFGDGVRKLPNGSSKWVYIRAKDGLANNNVRSITPLADGSVWFGTEGGASRWDANGWTSFTVADGLVNNNVYGIAGAPSRDVWFATAGGISRLDTKTSTWKSVPSDNMFSAIAVSPDGVPWASILSDGSIVQVSDSGANGLQLKTKKSNIPAFRLVFATNGILWIAGPDGVGKYDPVSGALEVYDRSTTKGYFADSANSLALASDGSVWIAADNSSTPAAYHFIPMPRTDTADAWQIYDQNDGIPTLPATQSDSVKGITVSPAGDLWIATTEHATRCSFEKH
jgi:ligand-binding sensor domain-containing protein